MTHQTTATTGKAFLTRTVGLGAYRVFLWVAQGLTEWRLERLAHAQAKLTEREEANAERLLRIEGEMRVTRYEMARR
jgi:hypothetical protein